MTKMTTTITQKEKIDVRKNLEWIEFYRQHPVLAAQNLLVRNGRKLVLPAHQRIVLKDLWSGTPFPMIIMTRGGGKSAVIAIYFILRSILYPNERLGILSSSYRQAKVVFDEITRFYNESPIIRDATRKGPSKGNDECRWELDNESIVKALPIGDGSKIRGQRFYKVFIDEFVQLDKEVLDSAIIPMLATRPNPTAPPKPTDKKNQLILASTATWQFMWAYETYQQYKHEVNEGNPNYSIHEFDCDDIGDFMDRDLVEYHKKHSPRIVFLMEFKLLWPSDSHGWFPASVIHKCRDKACLTEEKGQPGAEYVMGVDPARESDLFAISIIKITPNGNKLVKVETHKNQSFAAMHRRIRELMRDFNIVRIALDYGGGGLSVRDELSKENFYQDPNTDEPIIEEPILPINPDEFPDKVGRRILDVVYFSPKEIHKMNVELKADMENRRVLMPYEPIPNKEWSEDIYTEITSLQDELRSIVTSVTETGVIHFDTPSKRMIKDRYTSFLLANKAARDYLELKNQRVKPSELAYGFWVS